MKTLIMLTSLLLNLIVGYGQSGIYHPFPVSNAFWGDRRWNIFNPNLAMNTRYGLNGDTVLNGKVYTKVYSLYDSTVTNPLSTYYAAIREENRRIYTIVENSGEEILYDFNLSVGDTLFHHYSLTFHAPQEFYNIVSNVDSLQLFNGEYRKYLDFWGPSLSDRVVEGIGSIYWKGLFNPLESTIATNGDQFSLECFKQDETIIYLNNPYCDHCFCELYTGISDTKSREQLTITPNPFSKLTTVELANNLTNATLTIYNLFGQEQLQIMNLTGHTIILNRENLSAGLYILRIYDNNKSIVSVKIQIID